MDLSHITIGQKKDTIFSILWAIRDQNFNYPAYKDSTYIRDTINDVFIFGLLEEL